MAQWSGNALAIRGSGRHSLPAGIHFRIMRITAISQHGMQLTRFGLVNCFLVRDADGLTLIDANVKGSGADILAAAAGEPISRILLTHAHVDHMGSVDEIVANQPSLTIGASRRSLPFLKLPPDRKLYPEELRNGGEGDSKGEVKGATPGMATPVDLMLQAGDVVGSLRVIETPGHMPGHLAFLDERDGTLYAGDALFGIGHLGITGWAPWWFPLNKCWNRPQAKQSAEKLLEFDIQRFATGHGPIREGRRSALQQAIVRAKL
jgi:glyoxylase-like metal-dependent hydrolase (beta-lactamase superfamily II)